MVTARARRMPRRQALALWMNGDFVGTWRMGPGSEDVLEYDAVRAYFENLLPDSQDIRARAALQIPVSEAGQLGSLPAAYEAAKMIPALEAILIEALEPRQNRKRGDDLSAVEFIQREDPEIQKRRVKASLEAAIEKM